MPLQIISGPDAIENVKLNPLASWPARGENASRLEPLAKPGFEPSFRLNAGEKIFTIGSCFARNIELLLEQNGFEIPTRNVIKADPEFAAIGHNILNNYGVPSIFNEVSWALDPEKPFDESETFFEVFPGKYVDIHLNHALKPAPLETVRARRRAILNAYQSLRDCRVVIITLGLTECWYDKLSGTYLNTAPRRTLVRNEPDRFELRVLDYPESLDFVERTISLIKRHGHPDVRVVLTVSPVPLTATYRKEDVIIANSYSKSILRVVAESVTVRNDFVDYYPSYESVLHSERHLAFQDDQVHPTAEVIKLNVTRMVRAYVGSADDGLTDIREIVEKNPAASLSLLADQEQLLADNPDLAMVLLHAAEKVRRFDVVELALRHVQGLVPLPEQAVMRAKIALSRGDAVSAVALLVDEPERRVAKAAFWSVMLRALIGMSDLQRAHQAALSWAGVNPRTGEPFRILAAAYQEAGHADAAERLYSEALAIEDSDPRILLDYAEFLATMERYIEAEHIASRVFPENPSHTSRLGKLKVKFIGKTAAASGMDARVSVIN